VEVGCEEASQKGLHEALLLSLSLSSPPAAVVEAALVMLALDEDVVDELSVLLEAVMDETSDETSDETALDTDDATSVWAYVVAAAAAARK